MFHRAAPFIPSELDSRPEKACTILVLDGAGLPKKNGGAIRSRVILTALKDLGDVHVISVAASKGHLERFEPIDGVASQQVIVARRGLWGYGDTNKVRAAIDTIVQNNDGRCLVALRYLGAAQQAEVHKSPKRSQMCIWLDLDDRDDKLMLGRLENSNIPFARWFAGPLARAKKRSVERLARQSDLCTVATGSDLIDFAKGANTAELTNVVPETDIAQLDPPSQSTNIMFVGTYDWAPNVAAIDWFLTHCWRDLHRAHPEATLTLIGTGKLSNMTALKRKFGALPALNWNHDLPDLREHYADCRLVISPVISGSGSKIKVIEAAAYARPIVVTPHSSRGLNNKMRARMSMAQTPQDFTAACARYLTDPGKSDRDGRALQTARQHSHSITSFKRTLFTALDAVDHGLNLSPHILAPHSGHPTSANEVRR